MKRKRKLHCEIIMLACIAAVVPLLICMEGCIPVFMSAEDRFQIRDTKGSAENEEEYTNEAGSMQAVMSYEKIPYERYTVRTIAAAFAGLSETEISKYGAADENGTEWLELHDGERDISVSIMTDGSGFLLSSIDGGMQYYIAANQFWDLSDANFITLEEQYPEKELKGITREEAVRICSEAVSKTGYPFVYEKCIAMDSNSMNRLQDEGTAILGEGNVCGAPGSNDEWAEIIDGEETIIPAHVERWTQDQEAYAVYFRQEYENLPAEAQYLTGYLILFCRTDGKIVYACSNMPVLSVPFPEGKQVKGLSPEEAARIAAGLLKERYPENAQVDQVKAGYMMMAFEENYRALLPCWQVWYSLERNGRSYADKLYLDFQTGMEAKLNGLY